MKNKALYISAFPVHKGSGLTMMFLISKTNIANILIFFIANIFSTWKGCFCQVLSIQLRLLKAWSSILCDAVIDS